MENPALQKADMEWKMEKKNLFSIVSVCAIEEYIKSAPTNSTPTVKITTFNAARNTSFNPSCAIKSFVFSPSLKEELPLKKKAKKEVKVNIPIPPNCIKTKIIDCPTVVKSRAVSTTVSPVTHTALVEVKSALVNEIPLVVALGSINRKAPAMAKMKKLPTNIMAGLK